MGGKRQLESWEEGNLKEEEERLEPLRKGGRPGVVPYDEEILEGMILSGSTG